MKYLLDANAISHIVRFPTGKVAERLTEVGSELVFTSIIVAALGGVCFYASGISSGGDRVMLLVGAALFCQLRLLANVLQNDAGFAPSLLLASDAFSSSLCGDNGEGSSLSSTIR